MIRFECSRSRSLVDGLNGPTLDGKEVLEARLFTAAELRTWPDGAQFKIDLDRTDPAGSPRPMTGPPQAHRSRSAHFFDIVCY
jgi:hypothetical protein